MTTKTIRHRFQIGDKVYARDDMEYRPAVVTAISPYLGRPGYYIAWESEIGRPMDHHSKGGWKAETSVCAQTHGG